jgi:hypothetical protein
LHVLKILIRIPEILVWLGAHHRAPSWKDRDHRDADLWTDHG